MASKFPVSRLALILALFIVVYGIGLIPALLFLRYITVPLLMGGVASFIAGAITLPFVFFIFVLSEIVTTGLTNIIFRLRYKPGVYEMDLNDRTTFKWLIVQTVNYPITTILYALRAYPLKALHARLCGAKIGKNITLGGLISDPCLLEVGDNTIIGGTAEIICHSAERGKMILKPIKIGKNCSVGEGAILLPGAEIKDSAVLGALSLLPKNKKVPKGKVYGGVPAREIK